MSYSIINSVELIPFIEEAIDKIQATYDLKIKSFPTDLAGSIRRQSYENLNTNLNNSLFKLLKLAKTNEVVHLSADDAGIIYDYSESFKNRLNKGYR